MTAPITADELRPVLGVSEITVSDDVLDQVIDAAWLVLKPQLKTLDSAGDPIDYSLIAPVKEAVLAGAVNVYKTRQAPGGNYNAIDLTPNPYELGRSFFDRFEGMLTPYLSVSGWFG